ncbi:hypothetical protein PF010_g5517 [Phytophthora fragariae]|uniref:Uncharacterized protein n=1 Tax=Phytophthora fragariae TaxID=53985 RepID=A0A6G0LNC8_9STRA|nr:hypothetical protein PF010_g5517 [Phytophthora fragariae]
MAQASLRPRSNTAGVPEVEESGAALLPRHQAVASTTHAPSSGRSWLPRLLLLGGAVYAVLMLAWSSHNLSASESAASASQLTASGQEDGMDLAALLKAANLPTTDATATKQVQETQTIESTEEEEKEEEERATLYVATPIPTQAAIDRPMEASQVREALRQAREEVVATMEAEGSSNSAAASTRSGSQMSDEDKRQMEAEEQDRDVLLLPKGETRPRSLNRE